MQWLLFDVEGTITSLSFVKDELFPYARAGVGDFLERNANREDVRPFIERLARDIGADMTHLPVIAATLIGWMDEDRKQSDLKALQGLMWDEGYRRGAFRGHIYADVLPFWGRMKAAGARLAIYSSGSVHAQQLLLTYSIEGDVADWIERHFDTAVGPKAEAASYRRIAAELGVHPTEVVFFSDVVAELDAASAARMRTCHVVRSGGGESTPHPRIASFAEVESL